MSQADDWYASYLKPGEELCWESRPAPRCYTFRHWRHSIFGFVFLAISSYWQVLGLEMAATYAIGWLAILPVPFLCIGLYFSVGHLIQARLEWNNVYYAITDQRLLAQRGIRKITLQEIARDDITYFTLQRHGENLGTFKVHRGAEQRILLHCIEYPQAAVSLLEDSVRNNVSGDDTAQE